MLFGIRRFAWWLPPVLPLLLLLSAPMGPGCGSTRRVAEPSVAAVGADGVRSAPGARLSFQADVAPVAALAWSEPFLWIGSERGLRRVRLPAGQAEWVGPEPGLSGRRVSALGVDHSGRVLIATEAGLFRRETDGKAVRHQAIAKLPPVTVTHLVSGASGAAASGATADLVWVGTSSGLFLIEGGKTSAIDVGGRGAITSLDLDPDGRSVWVGVKGVGLARVVGRTVDATFGPGGADASDFVEAIGTAVLSNGTRIAIGRGANGGTRAVLLRLGGPVLLTAEPDLSVAALVATPEGPLLFGGTSTLTRTFALRLAERGEMIDADCVRFTPARKSLQEFRVVACPDARQAPAEVTAAVMGGEDVYVGTRAAGVARLVAGAPDYQAIGELALGARSVSVACRDRSACVVATGTGPGWLWDARASSVKPIPEDVGAGIGVGVLMAVVGDGGAAVYFVTGDGGKTIHIARWAGGALQGEPVVGVPIEVEGAPIITFAALSPDGNLWMAVRDRVASGQEFGRGVIEVQLPSGRAIHHRPYRETERRPPDALPIVGDVRAVRFQSSGGGGELDRAPPAIWFCTSMGVVRFAGGEIRRWGENEGLDSERCADIEVAADGKIWAATEAGPARFDGKTWRAWEGSLPAVPARKTGAPTVATDTRRPMLGWPQNRDGEPVAARALVAFNGGLWAGTPRGIWPLTAAGAPLDRAAGFLDDDIVDLVVDRFGRLWALGTLGLTVRDPPR